MACGSVHVNSNDRSMSYRVNQQAATSGLWLQVREIYETAIEAEAPYGLPDEDCKKMCLRYTHTHLPLLSAQGFWMSACSMVSEIGICVLFVFCQNSAVVPASHHYMSSSKASMLLLQLTMLSIIRRQHSKQGTLWEGCQQLSSQLPGMSEGNMRRS